MESTNLSIEVHPGRKRREWDQGEAHRGLHPYLQCVIYFKKEEREKKERRIGEREENGREER